MTGPSPSHAANHPQKAHHVLIFRHCIRAGKSSGVHMGHGQVADPLEFIASAPQWKGSVHGHCLPSRDDMTHNVGRWLVEGGLIAVGETAQWEILSDYGSRDSHTAVVMAQGIREGLRNIDKWKPSTSIGLQTLRLARGVVFHDVIHGIDDNDAAEALDKRQKVVNVERVPRPTLGFAEALNLMQVVCGVGTKGNLTKAPNFSSLLETEVAGDTITGAPAVLDFFARSLFYSRAGETDPDFCPDATVRHVYQFAQYIHWTKMALWSHTNWSARHGALHAHLLLQVLRHGSFLPGQMDWEAENFLTTKDDDYYGDDEYYSEDDDDDNDDDTNEISSDDVTTKVTILMGHNSDLHILSTAFDVHWAFRDPYYSGINGSFIPTAPLTGFHAVRYVEEDRVEMSVVYPTIVDLSDPHFDLDRTYFPVNASGILEQSPVLFQRPVPFARTGDRSTRIQSAQRGVSSVDVLEQHVLNVLADYGETYMYTDRAAWYKDLYTSSLLTTPATVTMTPQGTLLWWLWAATSLLVCVLCYRQYMERGRAVAVVIMYTCTQAPKSGTKKNWNRFSTRDR